MLTEQQDIDLINRTIDNLDFIESNQQEDKVWEVTQTINSFLSIVAHPRERLLDASETKWITLSDARVVEAGIPKMDSSWEFDSAEPRTLAQLLRLLRNGIAHGNVDLLSFRELATIRPDIRLEVGSDPTEIAGIEIWNVDTGKERTWGTVLTVDELNAALRGFAKLALSEELHNPNQTPKNGGRKEKQIRKRSSRRQQNSHPR